jgi:enterochelin esterase-like enzyme
MGRSRRRRGVVSAAVVPLVVLGCLLAGAAVVLARSRPAPVATAADIPPQAVSVTCPSPSLNGTLPAEVYLPVGYSPHAARFPVIYFLHGLPAGPQSYTQNEFVAATLIATHRRAIVVAPQGARTADSDREYLDWDAQEDWPAAISHDLTSCIDARFHTIASRYGRALMGLSAGGYGAFNVGLRNLQEFAAVESWSGYFAATDPSGYHLLSLGSPQAQSAATVPTGAVLRRHLASWPTMLGFYVGNQDARFLEMNRQYDASLRQSGIAHAFAVYPGGHTYVLWQAHAAPWLAMALRFMAAGRRHHLAAGGGASGL